MNSKGQEEAPFQLLVAVILMTFVIIVGLNAMKQAEQERCFNNTDSAMDKFVFALEQTTNNKSPSSIVFNPPGCSKNEKFLIKKFDDPRLCSNVCLGSTSSCVILRYSTSEVSKIPDKCINVDYGTEFRYHPKNSECVDLTDDKFEGTDILSGEGLEKGTFQFLYYDNPSIHYPIVCTYVKN
ncbi:hypothetical protein KKG83_03985 [Candidatus Micrarchaeota archaeon]|nr:hypothetical protein [Candidatus Micrarchaeota archaeon]MBU2476605.1 hypothetical protein [Candidatus Micrarchaeota archaeon]